MKKFNRKRQIKGLIEYVFFIQLLNETKKMLLANKEIKKFFN